MRPELKAHSEMKKVQLNLEVNGEPAMLMRVAGHLDSVYTFSFEDEGIAAIRVVRNPDKLQFLERQLTPQ